MNPWIHEPDMRPCVIAILIVGCLAARGEAQSRTATLSATFSGLARLTLSTASLTFPDADPDTIPQVAGNPAVVTITTKARATRNGTVTLTVQASGNLRSGLITIPASNITWTATGAGFVAGTLSSATPQAVAAWVGSGVRNGTQSFFFRNLWTHPTGTYTLTLLFTLSAA